MYAVYLRKSRADREFTSNENVLARHEAALLDLAKKRSYPIGKIFREVESGETLSARPQMQQLLSEVEAGVWEGVLVMEVERLARGNSIDQGIVSQAFMLSGTLIITPRKIYNPKNEFDEEYFEFGLFMSRREYKTINRRLSAGRLASCREGKYVGSVPPYGYDKIKLKGQKGWTLVPIEKEAENVKLIYRLYLSCEKNTGFQGIADRLSAMNITTRRNGIWTAQQIKYILTNDVYIGKIHWQRTPEEKKAKNGYITKTRRKAADYYIFDGLHSAIIDANTFDRVQGIINKRGKASVAASKPMKNPFSGVLICSFCKKPLKRRPPDKRRRSSAAYYCCTTKGCPNTSCKAAIIENKISEAVNIWLSKYCLPNNIESISFIWDSLSETERKNRLIKALFFEILYTKTEKDSPILEFVSRLP